MNLNEQIPLTTCMYGEQMIYLSKMPINIFRFLKFK